MSNWWVIDKETKAMIYSCDDAGKERCSIGGNHEWLSAPEGVAIGNCKVVVVSAAVPAVPAVLAVEAVVAVAEVIGVPAVAEVLDEEGNVITPVVAEVIAVPGVEAVEAVVAQDAIPAIPEVLGLVDGSADKSSPQWTALRAERNKRLTACDWTVLTDADLTTGQKNIWKAYRQALRDIPELVADPEVITWPVAP